MPVFSHVLVLKKARVIASGENPKPSLRDCSRKPLEREPR